MKQFSPSICGILIITALNIATLVAAYDKQTTAMASSSSHTPKLTYFVTSTVTEGPATTATTGTLRNTSEVTPPTYPSAGDESTSTLTTSEVTFPAYPSAVEELTITATTGILTTSEFKIPPSSTATSDLQYTTTLTQHVSDAGMITGDTKQANIAAGVVGGFIGGSIFGFVLTVPITVMVTILITKHHKKQKRCRQSRYL